MEERKEVVPFRSAVYRQAEFSSRCPSYQRLAVCRGISRSVFILGQSAPNTHASSQNSLMHSCHTKSPLLALQIHPRIVLTLFIHLLGCFFYQLVYSQTLYMPSYSHAFLCDHAIVMYSHYFIHFFRNFNPIFYFAFFILFPLPQSLL